MSAHLLPQPTKEVAEVIGLDAALVLSGKALAASSSRLAILYVPLRPRGKCWQRLVNLAGTEDAEKLIAEFGGEEIRFFPATAFLSKVRDASVRDYWQRSGLSAAWIGWMHDISERQVRNICVGEPRRAQVCAQMAPPRGA